LGLPFLTSTSLKRHQRSLAIIQEVHEYFKALAVAMPYLEIASSLPQNAPRPNIPVIPDCLDWQERVDQWGLSNPGTWLDQPKWFMEDIRAASDGRRRWQNEQVKQVAQQAMPEMAPMIAR